jgi:hypothetical protein
MNRHGLHILAVVGMLSAGVTAWGAGEDEAPTPPVRLFILSGQSNMARLDPAVSFSPAVEAAFAGERVLVVKHAVGGRPIRQWYKAWKAPEGIDTPGGGASSIGLLYDALMAEVREALGDARPDTVCFVWMQGERDAREKLSAVYAASLEGLLEQLRNDLGRDDVTAVIGRLSDYHAGSDPHWDAVRDAQVAVAEADPLASWVDTDDLNGDKDGLHYNAPGYAELGRRFAAEAIRLTRLRDGQAGVQAGE